MAKSISFTQISNTSGNEDDELLKDWLSEQPVIKFENGVKRLTLRPIGPLFAFARHWPKAPKTGSTTPPLWCPRFDPVGQKFDEGHGCPLHEDFGDKAQRVLVFSAIVREWQEGRNRKDNPVGVMLVSAPAVAGDMAEIVGINKADVTDPDKGCDIRFTYNREEKGPKKWSIQRVDRTPLTDEERNYDVPDLEKISPNWFEDKKSADVYCMAMKRKMVRLGYYVLPLNNGKDGWDAYRKDINGRPYTEFPELVGDGAAQQKEPRRSVAEEDAPRPAAKKKHDVPADEDLGLKRRQPVDDDEEEDVKPAKKAPVKSTSEDDEEVPFEAPVKKVKKVAVPETHTAWAAKMDEAGVAVSWKTGDDGDVVPACYGDFEGAPKCKKCPSRGPCIGS